MTIKFEYYAFIIAGAAVVGYIVRNNLKSSKMSLLSNEKITKLQHDSALLLNYSPDGIVIYKETDNN
jgi:hypothetical protein